MTHDSLDPIDPSTAVQNYLKDRSSELSDNTLYTHEKRLNKFIDWCIENEISNMNNITGRKITDFKEWRQGAYKKDEIAPETLRSCLSTLRIFTQWCVSINAVDKELPEKILIPNTSEVSDVILNSDHAEEILNHLSKYEYASDAHVIMRILWSTGMRLGALIGLDLGDFDESDECLELNHRPDSGTPLKNKTEGERLVALDSKTVKILSDYIDTHRVEKTDDHGRRPLLTTPNGRRSPTATRRLVYGWTRPCAVGLECPAGRDPDQCSANSWASARDCPDSVSPHPVRRGSITHYLREDVPERAISDRADVSPDVLDKHYDKRTDREKMEQRRRYF